MKISLLFYVKSRICRKKLIFCEKTRSFIVKNETYPLDNFVGNWYNVNIAREIYQGCRKKLRWHIIAEPFKPDSVSTDVGRFTTALFFDAVYIDCCMRRDAV
jgi:hypothetical protein